MSAETLRRAAALMRKRAESASQTGRRGWADGWKNVIATTHMPHVKSWHPSVALAVADWLDITAGSLDAWHDGDAPEGHPALTVARAYLGEQP